MRIAAILIIAAAPFALAGERPGEPFAPLAFLAGSCWSGTFPDGRTVDKHCFSWMYDGAFLRDVHVVKAPDRPDYRGETIYHWDGDAGVIAYRYYNSLGGVSDGVVRIEGDLLVFPSETYRNGDVVQVFRSSWKRNDSGGYLAITEEKADGGWKESLRIGFKRSGAAE